MGRITQKRPRVFLPNEPYVLRVYGALAAEIGFNESIVFLQLEYLIGISSNVRDGEYWTYQSLQEMKDNYFPWWGTSTIHRAIQALQKRNLIKIGQYNKAGYDRTQWYALDLEGCSRLKSVRMIDASISQDGISTSQSDESVSRDGTTIPKTTQRENVGLTPELRRMAEHSYHMFPRQDNEP